MQLNYLLSEFSTNWRAQHPTPVISVEADCPAMQSINFKIEFEKTAKYLPISPLVVEAQIPIAINQFGIFVKEKADTVAVNNEFALPPVALGSAS